MGEHRRGSASGEVRVTERQRIDVVDELQVRVEVELERPTAARMALLVLRRTLIVVADVLVLDQVVLTAHVHLAPGMSEIRRAGWLAVTTTAHRCSRRVLLVHWGIGRRETLSWDERGGVEYGSVDGIERVDVFAYLGVDADLGLPTGFEVLIRALVTVVGGSAATVLGGAHPVALRVRGTRASAVNTRVDAEAISKVTGDAGTAISIDNAGLGNASRNHDGAGRSAAADLAGSTLSRIAARRAGTAHGRRIDSARLLEENVFRSRAIIIGVREGPEGRARRLALRVVARALTSRVAGRCLGLQHREVRREDRASRDA